MGDAGVRVPFSNASRMCQNIVLMRFVEPRGRLTKVFCIVKMRDSDFDTSLRTLAFGPGGLVLEPKE